MICLCLRKTLVMCNKPINLRLQSLINCYQAVANSSLIFLIFFNEKNLTIELFAHGYLVSGGVGANAVGIRAGN